MRSFYSDIWFRRPRVLPGFSSQFRVYDGQIPKYIEVKIASSLCPGENRAILCNSNDTKSLLNLHTCFELIEEQKPVGNGVVVWVNDPIFYSIPAQINSRPQTPLFLALYKLSRLQDTLYTHLSRGLPYVELP